LKGKDNRFITVKLNMQFGNIQNRAVDWSEDWSTPRGSAIEERRLKPSHPVIMPS
jgi:hypothetical protein